MTSNGELSVRVLTRNAELEGIRSIWEAMQSHPNADIDYFSLINELHAGKPYVIVVFQHDQVITIAAGRLMQTKFKCSFGYKTVFAPTVNELSIISGGLMGTISEPVLGVIVKELRHALKLGIADVASVAQVRADSPLWELVLRSPAFLCRDAVPKAEQHHAMALPKSPDGLFLNMKSKHRTNVKKLYKVLERDFPGKVDMRCFHLPTDVAKFCADADAVAATSYLRGLGMGFSDSTAARQHISLYAARSVFRGYILYIEEKPCAFWFGNVYRSVFFVGMTAFDARYSDYEVGTALLVKMLEDLVVNCPDVTQFDFGLGDAVYKRKFSTEDWSEATLYMFAPSLRGIGINMIRTPLLGGTNLVKTGLRRLNWEGKIKRFWRNSARKELAG